MSDFERVQIDFDQFSSLEKRLGAIRDRLGLPSADHSIQQTLEDGFKDLSKWLSIQNDSIIAGFAMVAEALTSTNLPPPGPPAKVGSVKFIFPGLTESE